MRRGVARAALLAVIVMLAGCSGQGGAAAPTSSSSPAPPTPPATAVSPNGLPAVSARCGGSNLGARTFRLRTSDGAVLAAVEAGSSIRGVVLVPERGRRGLCGWWDYATYLSTRGFRVLLFDHRCMGESSCPSGRSGGKALMRDIEAAIGRLRRDGAIRVALLGGSQGAAEVLIAASRAPAGVTGAVALSADELNKRLAAPPYPATAGAAAPKLRLPVLFAVAKKDKNVSVTDTRRLVAATGAARKRLSVLPADAGHGWDLVSIGPSGARPKFSTTVFLFLRTVTS